MGEELKLWDEDHFKGHVVFRDEKWNYFGPLIRADFQLFDEYEFLHSSTKKFDFPIHSWHMERDHFITAEMVRMWGHWTNGVLDFRTMPFGHFSDMEKERSKQKFF